MVIAIFFQLPCVGSTTPEFPAGPKRKHKTPPPFIDGIFAVWLATANMPMLAHRYLHHVDICLICLPFADMFLFIYSFMLCKRASAQDCNFLRAPRAKELIRTHGLSRLHYLQQMDLVPKFLCSWHPRRMSSSMLWRAQNMLRLVPCWPHVRL